MDFDERAHREGIRLRNGLGPFDTEGGLQAIHLRLASHERPRPSRAVLVAAGVALLAVLTIGQVDVGGRDPADVAAGRTACFGNSVSLQSTERSSSVTYTAAFDQDTLVLRRDGAVLASVKTTDNLYFRQGVPLPTGKTIVWGAVESRFSDLSLRDSEGITIPLSVSVFGESYVVFIGLTDSRPALDTMTTGGSPSAANSCR
jgi:hypothetical protein